MTDIEAKQIVDDAIASGEWGQFTYRFDIPIQQLARTVLGARLTDEKLRRWKEQ